MKFLLSLFAVGIFLTFAFAPQGTFSYPSSEGQRLIQTNPDEPGKWLTIVEVDALVAKHANFMDITDHPNIVPRAPGNLIPIPTEMRFRPNVTAAIAQISVPGMTSFLQYFTSYFNRYYTTVTGVGSSDWLLMQVQTAIRTSSYRGVVSTIQFTHSEWPQKSIIATIEGTDDPGTGLKETVVIGAHLDCMTTGAAGQSPGADDNGSGSTVIFEAFRALLESGFIPKRTIEFHWYAAEEVGLRGSQDIVAAYREAGLKDVVAMANFDMAGYLTPSNPRVGFITDFTDAELNDFLRKAVEEYCSIGWMNRTCGYGCSDHASWFRDGVRAAFPHEDVGSPYAHTVNDTITNLNVNYMAEFVKLAIGFAIEIAEPSTTTIKK